MSKTKKLLCALLLAALVGGCVWYARPVDLYTLMPGMEPDLIDVLILRNAEHGGIDDRSLRLKPGDTGFDETLSRLEALRFRRSPLNLLRQAFPFLEDLGGQRWKQTEDNQITQVMFGLAQDNDQEVWRSEELRFWVDEWTYRDMDRAVDLPLSMKSSKEVGQDLGEYLWDLTEEAEAAP